jgi:hypothetical protein
MIEQQLLLQRFEATKVANFKESMRLEGLKPVEDKSTLPAKVIAKLKELRISANPISDSGVIRSPANRSFS